jgi:putative CocE/NonD family hydrolase
MDVLVEKNVQVAMRDGVELATDVYRPNGVDDLPVLLMRHPYDKELPSLLNLALDVMRAAQHGYAVVVQDTRGRYASAGVFDPFFDEALDGADTVAWCVAQPWSSGKVGMVGGSYYGATQWLAAREAPEGLLAIAPFITAADYHEGWAYQGGAFELGFNLTWTLSSLALGELTRRLAAGQAQPEDLGALVRAVDDTDALFWNLPLTDQPQLQGLAPYYFDWLAHPDYDDFWKTIAPREHYDRVTVPALNIGGWFDIFLGGTLANYVAMKEQGGSDAARGGGQLIIGPWGHGPLSGWFPERSFGVLSGTDGFDLTGAQLRWFDHHLRGHANGAADGKPVRLFVMGANVWREEDDWPLPDTEWRPYYLHSGGKANTAGGDGALTVDKPGEEPHDAYLYDPRNPVPTIGGNTFLPGLFIGANSGPKAQNELDTRHDVLVFQTEPLEDDLEVTGPVELILHAGSSALDTDFTAKLSDVAPDGTAMSLCDGILRARYRDSVESPVLLDPAHVYELRIDLWATANVFRAGHRIRLDVSSSNFPRFDRNSNTGGIIAEETEADFVQAVNRVFHDDTHPSRLILPVIAR